MSSDVSPATAPQSRDPQSRDPLLRTTGVVVENVHRERIDIPDLRVSPGDVVVLSAPMTCETQYIVFSALGLHPTCAGAIELLGVRLENPFHDALMTLRERVGLYTPHAPILANLTIRQNLALPFLSRGMPAAEVEARVLEALEEFQLTPFAERRTVGHRDLIGLRAGIARALSAPAALYLLDEPLQHYEERYVPTFLASVARRQAQGAGVLICTHRPAPLLSIATRHLFRG